MSQRLIDLNPELKQLRDEGYNIGLPDGFLVVREVPYLNATREIKRGVLMMPLALANDVVQPPSDHQAQFAGEQPCQADGSVIQGLAITAVNTRAGDVVANWNFSAKPMPEGRYRDFHHKVTSYVRRLSDPAVDIDPLATARVYPLVVSDDPESVFEYVDTATSRAQIVGASRKLMVRNVAILGLGGTGGYILDLLAKTPVGRIHLFDGDTFDQHNAFRAPGAAAGVDLAVKMLKVEYFRRAYSRMHKGIVAHPGFITPDNLGQLDEMDFVFVAMEAGNTKRLVVERLLARGISFVDVGMGVYLTPAEQIGGTLRVTTATPGKHDHLGDTMPFSDGGLKNEYDKNIQIADLNALNAALAVIRWKTLCGFYACQTKAHHTKFAIGRHEISNEEIA